MEENKNDIDDLVKSIDSSFKEMSLKDIVATHDGFFDAESLMEKNHDKYQKKEMPGKIDKPQKIMIDDVRNTESSKNRRISDTKKDRQNHKTDNTIAKNTVSANKKEHTNIISEENNIKDMKKNNKEEKIRKAGIIGNWFQTCCYINIPIVGFIYVLVLAFRKKTPEEKKYFAKGYLLYKVMVWLLAIVLLYCLYKLGLDFIDGMLSFIKG